MTDDGISISASSRRQSATVVMGVLLVALAIAAGSWYGFTAASNAGGTPVGASPRSQVAAPGTGRLPNSSGISKGESIISQPFYDRPAPVFDAVAAMALTASAPASAASKAASATGLTGVASSATGTATADVLPAGWAGAGVGLDIIWETNAVAGWKVRATPLTAPNWRISGVVQRGPQTQILVQFDGEPNTRFFKVGDVLPGGGKLAWVKPNVIGVSFPEQKPLSVSLVEDPFQPASSAGSTAAASGQR